MILNGDLNRKEDNDQESIQLPNTFRSKTPKKDALKVTAPQSKDDKQKAKRTVSSPKMAKRLSKITIASRQRCKYIQLTTAEGPPWNGQLKYYCGSAGEGGGGGGGGVNRVYVATTFALSSAVVYTGHLFSPREGFLTHQCNIFENIKIKRIQRWNNDETRQQEITEMVKQKETNSRIPVGPIRDRTSDSNRLI